MDSVSENMSIVFMLLLVLLCLLSIFPWNLSRLRYRFSLFLPLTGIMVFALYELTIRLGIPSESVPILLDVLMTAPLMTIILTTGLVGMYTSMRACSQSLAIIDSTPHQVVHFLSVGVVHFSFAASIY